MTVPGFHLGVSLAPEVTSNKNNEPVNGLEDKWRTFLGDAGNKGTYGPTTY